ncbi:hypothetical protein Salat_0839000, partial [Sesamum alatum]
MKFQVLDLYLLIPSNRYMSLLARYPVTTKAITSAFFTLVGDFICQSAFLSMVIELPWRISSMEMHQRKLKSIVRKWVPLMEVAYENLICDSCNSPAGPRHGRS